MSYLEDFDCLEKVLLVKVFGGGGGGVERFNDGWWFGGCRESEGFRYDDWNFGGRKRWGVNIINGVKQGTSRDADT